jgi:hypothetical protein
LSATVAAIAVWNLKSSTSLVDLESFQNCNFALVSSEERSIPAKNSIGLGIVELAAPELLAFSGCV